MNMNAIDQKLDKEASIFVQCFERLMNKKEPYTLVDNKDIRNLIEGCNEELKK